MLEADLASELSAQPDWNVGEDTPARVARLWRTALGLQRNRRYLVAAVAVSHMAKIDPSLAQNELIVNKIVQLHNEAVRHPLSVVPKPPEHRPIKMIPLPEQSKR